MNLNIKIFLLCPVPDNQKPITEYISLKQNTFTNWILKKKNEYKKIIFFSILVTFSFSVLAIHNIFTSIFYTTFFLIFFFLILFFRWNQTTEKLETARLFYEEASWYDGQIWEKPLLIIKNDQLIKTQKIKPILQRISRFLLTLFFFNIIHFILIN